VNITANYYYVTGIWIAGVVLDFDVTEMPLLLNSLYFRIA